MASVPNSTGAQITLENTNHTTAENYKLANTRTKQPTEQSNGSLILLVNRNVFIYWSYSYSAELSNCKNIASLHPCIQILVQLNGEKFHL